MTTCRSGFSVRGSNSLAITVCTASLLALYTSFDPVPAGEELNNDKVTAAAEVAANFVIQDEVPLPPDANVTPSDRKIEINEPADETPELRTNAGVVLSDMEAIQFMVYLLRDGMQQLENVNHYQALFTKQERINGDLTGSQTIEMKVQHSPAFSVYMKWKNGDAGRQVLYSDQYEDGQMVVKLGGLKGRLLPAIKLDPKGERAMSESRYPVTEAGLLGMIKQIVHHRENDLKRGYGVRCRRLPNQEFDNHDCMCFSFEYENSEAHPTYRKSIILVDSRRHLPLMARNFTWATDAEGMSPDELDEMTLIENYSFTSVNFDAELVAEDFSRENRKYRM